MNEIIRIHNEENSLIVDVFPECGGMIGRIQVDGRKVLYLDETRLTCSPLTAGGIPILFPFAGKTKNDTYEINGKIFHMPKHGFIHNKTFAIKGQTENSVTLWIKGDETMSSGCYPFSFTLEITYQLITHILIIDAHIINHSPKPMPHALGWHPYFKVSDRRQLQFIHHMLVQYDYIHEMDRKAPETIELEKDWDDVFCEPLQSEYSFINILDGYKLRCSMGKSYNTIVVYTGRPGSVCIEPWCGMPDSIHNGRLLEWIPAGESKDYVLEYHLHAL